MFDDVQMRRELNMCMDEVLFMYCDFWKEIVESKKMKKELFEIVVIL